MDVLSNNIPNSKKVEKIQMPLYWWMDNQMWYIHTMEYYSTIKKNEVQIPATKEQTLKIS